MFVYIYIENGTEFHRNIQNINLLYKSHQQHQNTFSEFDFCNLDIHSNQRCLLVVMARLWRAKRKLLTVRNSVDGTERMLRYEINSVNGTERLRYGTNSVRKILRGFCNHVS